MMLHTFRRLFGSNRIIASMTLAERCAVVIELNLQAGRLAWGW